MDIHEEGGDRVLTLSLISPPAGSDIVEVAYAADEEILPVSHHSPPPTRVTSVCNQRKLSDPNQRLASLDVFRGLTVALMILADDAGGAIPSINHAPWFDVTVADFVMPFFLFGVGVAIALACRKATNKLAATRKIIMRTIKLFWLGVLLQGGYFHGRNHLTYGVDFDCIRLLGVLQRIAIGYFLGAMSEIWLINYPPVNSPTTFVKKYYIQWIIAMMLSAMYIALLFGVYVPNWTFEVSSSNSTLSIANFGLQTEIVYCGLRGNLDPPCNAVGFIDRLILGEKHLYQNPVYKRTKECSIKSPDYGPLPPNFPEWCLAPFDPEGILSSVMAAVTCYVGLQFGHVIIHIKSHMKRSLLWTMSSLILLLLAFVVAILGMPLSKPLYTLSYMFLTAGGSGIVLSFLYFLMMFYWCNVLKDKEQLMWKATYSMSRKRQEKSLFVAAFYLVDVKHISKPFLLFQWMGTNALFVYVLAASELFPAVLQGFYWRSPSNNLVSLTESILQTFFHSKKWGTLAFVLLEILFWCLVSGFLNIKGIYFKL